MALTPRFVYRLLLLLLLRQSWSRVRTHSGWRGKPSGRPGPARKSIGEAVRDEVVRVRV